MTDKEIETYYRRMCREEITSDFFYDVVRDVPSERLFKIVENVESQKTRSFFGVVIVVALWIMAAFLAFIYFGGLRYLLKGI